MAIKFPVRLDRLVSQVSGYSRSEVKQLIKKGLVSLNGDSRLRPEMKVNETDQVTLDGRPLDVSQNRYYMLHKPAGYVCARRDGGHATVFELLAEPRTEQLSVAGRLDIDTTGLVLLSDDGKWVHRVTSPRYHCVKVYRVSIEKPLSEADREKLKSGIWLNNEKVRTREAGLEMIDELTCRLGISEGRYHQVKRMFIALDNRVTALHREQIGELKLESELEPGQYRPLTAEEAAAF